jgi:hypothetical protein
VRPDVSVVIVNWNAKDVLRGCLESVFAETRGVEYEVIVVDNASSDSSAEMVRDEFPQAKVIANGENRGFAAGNNDGIAAANGRYVLLLNPDTIIRGGAIQKAAAFADAHEDAGVVGCRVWDPDGSRQYTCHRFPSVVNTFCAATGLAAALPTNRFFGGTLMRWWEHNETREVDAVAGCFMLVRREALEEVGGLDERYFMYVEEIDWCYRFRKAGWNVYFYHEAEIVHLMGASSKVSERDMRIEKRKSLLKFFRMNGGALSAWAANALMAAGDVIRIVSWGTAATVKRLAGRDAGRLGSKTRTAAKALAYHLFGVDESTEVPHTFKRRLRDKIAMTASAAWYAAVLLPATVLRRLTGRPDRRVIVLYYHSVYGYQRDEFAKHLDMLLAAGRPAALGREAEAAGEGPAIAVTFDDAFANIARNALPELAKRGIPATIFVPVGSAGGPPGWEMREGSPDTGERVMTAEELKGLGGLVAVGSHSLTHRRLRELTDEEAYRELADSRRELEAMVGRPVETVAFPHGSYSARTVELAREAGYRRAYSICPVVSREGSGEFVVGRCWEDLDGSRLEHWLKLRGAYSCLGPLQRLKKRICAPRRSEGAAEARGPA